MGHPLLDNPPVYVGDEINVAFIEELISRERQRQDHQVTDLRALRERNTELQENLVGELAKLQTLSEQLRRHGHDTGIAGAFRRLFSRFGGDAITRSSIEDLLRRQYELSAVRVKEAAELADRLKMAESDLRDEIERLSERIIRSAKNEEVAARYVQDVQAVAAELESELFLAQAGSAAARELQADVDKTRRVLAEHGARLRLYQTAEDRLARLQENTRQLAETVGHLQSDLAVYVTAAGEQLDMIGGQIQAIGAAADASVVMLEMKRSLDAMTESINHATRFVSETQAYFREHVDNLVDDLRVYDEETQAALTENLALSEGFADLGLAEAISEAVQKRHELELAESARDEVLAELEAEVET